jgi:hypothetical protein
VLPFGQPDLLSDVDKFHQRLGPHFLHHLSSLNFNRDLACSQLAGDLLPNATLSQKIATGFNRNSKTNDEGGGVMIGKLKGIVDSYGVDFIILDVGGVGYQVHCSARTLQALPAKGEAVTLAIETHVREDQIILDLVNIPQREKLRGKLVGLCW